MALSALGIPLEKVRDEVIELLDADAVREPVKTPPFPPPATAATSDAIRALRAADDEAARRRHGFVGTEHLLVGVVEGDGRVARLLHETGATAEAVRRAMDSLRSDGDGPSRPGRPPYSASAERALDRAKHEAAALGHAMIDARHLALALLAVREGLAAHVLHRLVAAPDALAAKLRALQPRT
jgi:ATP-dependent Clp protease ATP-binding subunit ClpC